jgi:hypothetical protein
MSNVVKISSLFAKAKLPVRSLGEGINITGFSSISIKGQRWALKHKGETFPFTREDDNSPLTYLDVVILDTNPYTSKIYFGDGPYNEETASGPICASIKGDVPDPGVSMPQSRACANCPHNAWGSGGSGRGKACQDNRRLAVMLMPKMTQNMKGFNGIALLDPVFLKIPAGSLRTCKAYSDQLDSQGLPFYSVVTRLSFNPQKQFEIMFELREALSDKAAQHVIPWITDSLTQQIIGLTPTALPAPAAVEEEAEPEPEPSASDQLLSAFDNKQTSAPTTNGSVKRPGRPPGSKNKPKQLELQANKEPDPPAEAQGGDWEESDTNIDSEVNRLLRQKAADMM